MATQPQFGASAFIAWNTAAITAANTAKDGTGTVVTLLKNGTEATTISSAANGTWVDYIQIEPIGTNVATVMRFWANNGGANTTAANNTLMASATCPASTNSEVAALQPIIVPVKKWFPPSWNINVTIGTAVAAGFKVTAYGSVM